MGSSSLPAPGIESSPSTGASTSTRITYKENNQSYQYKYDQEKDFQMNRSQFKDFSMYYKDEDYQGEDYQDENYKDYDQDKDYHDMDDPKVKDFGKPE